MGLLLPVAALAQLAGRIVVPNAAGGTLDGVARLLARYMFEGQGTSVMVENRPGGDGTVATHYVLRLPADGRTLLLVSTSFAVSSTTHALDFDIQRDLQPVIKIASGEIFLVANAALDARTPDDLKRLAQLRPGGLNCAALPGQTTLACERLGLLLGGGMVTIPFQSVAPAINALVAGHVDVMFTPRAAAPPLVASQQIRILASTTSGPPAPPYQNLPLLKDLWPNMRMSTSASVYVIAGAPATAVASLNRELNRVLALPEVRATLQDQGYAIVGGSPEVLAASLADEIGYYRQVVQDLKLKPEALR
ncbi:MAG: tripartite tricarboxylate transporter substrate binding protein [Ramlibacter sp.]|nr:tripartite tricarboxylate transporter substrate binding protein [Ramlibacter sp.]